MPIKSRWTIHIPDVSLPTVLFKSPTYPLSRTNPIFLDAEDPTKFLTYHAYRLWCQRFAAGLRKHGFKPGDRLLLFSGNNILFPVVFIGTVMAGGVFTGANPTYVARELAYQLKNSGALFMLCARASLDTGLDAASQIDLPKSQIFIFDDAPITNKPGQPQRGCQPWSKLIASVEEGENYRWPELKTPEECQQTIVLNYSSGTTGVPKGVMISHKNYVSNTLQQQFMTSLQPEYEEYLKTARGLCFVPLYHAMGQIIFSVSHPMQEIPVYIMPKFNFEQMLDCVQKYRITSLTLVPPVVVAMAKHPMVKAGKWDLSSVQRIGSGAAPLGREVSEELESHWKGTPQEGVINVTQGWGMTEATCTATSCAPDRRYETSTVGEPLPNSQIKVMNEEGTEEVPYGQRGEIWVKGPQVCKGYWHNEKATKETITEDGWLRTGDICYLDQGLVYIVDRKKELIKVKGNQVAPAELEALLLDHPAVADAAVIGVERDGEEYPRAYIVLNRDKYASAEDILAFMDKRVSRTKRLTGGVRFVDMIPKNPSGKILRRFLRDKAKSEDEKVAASRL